MFGLRTYWTIVKLDIYSGTVLGLPGMINFDYLDQLTPSGDIYNYADESSPCSDSLTTQRMFAASVQYLRLLLIMGKVVQKLYPKTDAEARCVSESKQVYVATLLGLTDLPVIADADTGLGGPLNIRRTVEPYEHAGMAGIHIEDQVFPKRCGQLKSKDVVNLQVFLGRVRSAVEARRDPEFVIIARPDARQAKQLGGSEAGEERQKRTHKEHGEQHPAGR
jgi:hypothetical protein